MNEASNQRSGAGFEGVHYGAPTVQPEVPQPVPHNRRASKSKIPLEPAPQAVLPEKGWPKVKLWYNRKRNLADPNNRQFLKVPPLSQREQKQRFMKANTARRINQEQVDAWRRRNDHMNFWYDFALYITYLQRLVATPHLRINIMSRNVKGTSGKTARSLGIGNAISHFGGRSMLLLTSTLNTPINDAGPLSGIPEQNWARLSDIEDVLDEINTPADFANHVPTTNGRLFVIAEDRDENVVGRQAMTAERFFKIADKLNPLVYGGVIFDTGQDKIDNENFVFGVAARATVIVFCTLASSPMSRAKMSTSIRGLSTAPDDFGMELSNGHHVSIQTKVANSVLVVNGVEPGEKIDFDEFTTPQEESSSAPATEGFHGVTMTTPYEATLATVNGSNQVTYNLFKISDELWFADLLNAVKCYEQAAKVLGIDIAGLKHKIEPDFDAASRLLGRDIRYVRDYMIGQLAHQAALQENEARTRSLQQPAPQNFSTDRESSFPVDTPMPWQSARAESE